jgi:glycosyltransferase involved in cell wall biosynthesis
MTRRVFIDVTRTAREPTYTGIQKVVRTTFRSLEEFAPDHGCEVIPIAIDKRGAYRLDGLAFHPFELDERVTPAAPPVKWRVMARLRRFAAAKPTTFPRIAARVAVQRLESLAWHARRVREALEKRDYLHFTSGDVLLLPDSAWVENPWPVVSQLKANGGSLAAISYDLIPITHPHFFSRTLVASFRDYLEKLAASADSVICISDTVKSEFQGFAISVGAKPEIATVYPIIRVVSPPLQPRGDLAAAFGRVSVLIVATIEPRKGHALLLDACEALWGAGVNFNLVIIGRIGWQVEELMMRLLSHPEHRARLFLFHDASDADVAYALMHARIMVFPSIAEGLGLPILEAQMVGCPTLCSDIPVFREIASPSTRFFSPYTAEALQVALHSAITDPVVDQKRIMPDLTEEGRSRTYARDILDFILSKKPNYVRD